MTIKTFDSNRVGGGTFQIKQDPLTGDYKVEEVGFVKLPELKLPEIDQAPFKLPKTEPDDPTDDPADPGTGTGTGGGGSGGGGGGQDQTFTDFDYTGTKEFQNIQNQATQLSKSLQTMIDNQEAQERAAGVSGEGTPLTTTDVSSANQEAQERAAGIGPEKQFASQMIAERKASQMGPGSSNPRKPGRSLEQRNIPEASQALDDEYYDFDRTPINQGTFTRESIDRSFLGEEEMRRRTPINQGTFTKESIDKSFLGEEGPSQNLITKAKDTALKAKDVVSNSKPVQLIGAGIKMGTEALVNLTTSPQQQALNRSNKDALSSLGYKTRGELGGSVDPGRIAGNPADNVFAGMNAQSARGNIMTGSANRIKTRETVGIQRVEARYGKDSQQAKDFRAKTETFKNQRQEVLDKKEEKQAKINQQTMNQGPAGQDPGADKQGCVIATHAVNSGAFTADTKREAVRWCVKNLHRTWWGEAIRRGYRYYGQKAINEGNAKNHYQEFKDYVAFGTGKKRTLKTAWTFIYRTIQFFIKGVTIKK